MSCFGNTIARALALVSIGTAAAFVDWGFRPLDLELDAPEPEPASAHGAQEVVADPSTEEAGDQSGSAETEQNDTETAEQQDEPTAFDPNTLGTEIYTDDTYQLWLTGEVAFIDARTQREYEEGHIPYAYHIPVESIDQGRLGDMMDIGGVDPSQRIVVYCEGGLCDASKIVALTLQKDLGFKRIHINMDGFPAWQDAGYEVETGPDMMLGDTP